MNLPIAEAEPIVNRVAQSEIEVFDLASLWDDRPLIEFDLAPFLFKGLVLREKPFRKSVKEHDWQSYRDAHVAVSCSTDAILPTWAPMLVAARLHGVARSVTFGTGQDLVREFFSRAIEEADWGRYTDRIVVIKGCGGAVVPLSAYMQATQKMQSVARKIMFGEPCSSVPLWRKPPSASQQKR